MTTAEATAKFRFLGITDESTVCDRCGKTELRSTVVLALLDVDGNDEEIVYYGSTCAARALARTGRGMGRKVLDEARYAHTLLAQQATDSRNFFAVYQWDTHTVEEVAELYAWHHRMASWASETTREGWIQRAQEMIDRRTAILADAAVVGV